MMSKTVEKSWITNPRGSKDAKRKNTIVRKFVDFINKAIPPNAVYVSQEEPLEGTKVFQTDHGKQYWIRKPTSKESTARPWPKTKVGTHVLNNIDKDSSILDFGAGHGKQTTRLKNVGFKNVTAYDTREYGKDSPTTTNKDVLKNKYDVVMAGNVLNVQANDKELNTVLNEMMGAVDAKGKIIANFPSTPNKHPEIQNVKAMEERLKSYFNTVEKKPERVFELSDPKIQKEGDGGDGGFGEGGGTVFTSANAGIFTPTHSERGAVKHQKKKKKASGIERLGDYLTDNSPERKMIKENNFSTDLVKWVAEELSKENKKHFRQQTSAETINEQPPRIDWKKGNKEMPREDGYSEYDAKPDKMAAIEQDNETRRIKRLDDEKDDEEPKDTGSAGQTAPAGLTVQLGWESGGSEVDELHRSGDKDKTKGEVEDPEDEHEDEEFIRNIFKELDVSVEIMDELDMLLGKASAK